jgi:hypothetical protein
MTTDTIADQDSLTTANVADSAVTPDAPAAIPADSAPADPNTARRQTIAAAFDALGAEEGAEPTKAALPKVEPAAAPAPTIDPITGRAVEPMKPPASMSAALREKWSTVDPQFQKYWLDRERDMATKLTETADERKFAKEMRDVIAPHEASLSSLGTTAAKHVSELLELSRGLHAGTPQQRAKIIVDLTNHFKPDANTMVALFNGQAVQVPPVQAPQRQLSEQEIADKVIAEREQAQFAEEAKNVLAQFQSDPANEFLPDVQERMAKLISAGLVEGDSIIESYKNAYDMAVAQDKGIQEVLKARALTPQIQPAQAARQAPRSVKPSLGTGRANAPASKPMSSREAVAAAWEQLKP